MKKLILALAATATLSACVSPQRARIDAPPPSSSPAKRITVVGNEVTLPDGSRAMMDRSGGFDLPNGDRVTRDARGALLLPNGNRCLPEAGGYACP